MPSLVQEGDETASLISSTRAISAGFESRPYQKRVGSAQDYNLHHGIDVGFSGTNVTTPNEGRPRY